MFPVLALVGRPNVGKSTLFNRLTQTRDALVSKIPGMTRDRQYGEAKINNRTFIVIDTGGLEDSNKKDQTSLFDLTEKQTLQALQEADYIIFVVDGREGLTAADREIAKTLRNSNKSILLGINKTEGLSKENARSEFYELGFNKILLFSAAHGQGIENLTQQLYELFPAPQEEAPITKNETIRLTVIGRPNTGKSTLINRMLGENRMVTSDIAGTTRDSIQIPLTRHGVHYTLIDTAGLRRRGKVTHVAEKFSIVKTLQAMQMTDVSLLLLDASEGITDQDLKLLGMILDHNKALVIALNKWDGLPEDQKNDIKYNISRRLAFIPFIRILFISAKFGTGVGNLFDAVKEAYQSANRKLVTSTLNKILQEATMQHAPPLVHGRRIKLRYAHGGGNLPPCIIIHGNQVDHLPANYKRYLENFFQSKLKLKGTPLKLEFKLGDNPFKDKKNILTPTQQRKRKRLIKHVKK